MPQRVPQIAGIMKPRGPCSFFFAIDASKSAADSKGHEATGNLLFFFAIDASKSAVDSKDHETRTKNDPRSVFYLWKYQRATESSAELVLPIHSGAAVRTYIGWKQSCTYNGFSKTCNTSWSLKQFADQRVHIRLNGQLRFALPKFANGIDTVKVHIHGSTEHKVSTMQPKRSQTLGWNIQITYLQ